MKDKRGAPTQRFSVGDRVLSFVRYNVHQLCCFKALGKAVKGVSVLYACREINTRLDCRACFVIILQKSAEDFLHSLPIWRIFGVWG